MNIFRSFAGALRVELTSADIADLLTTINNAEITLTDIKSKNNLITEVTVCRRDFRHLNALVAKRGDQLKIVRKIGIYWSLTQIRNRSILAAGIVAILLAALFLPTRVLFVRVEGNRSVTTQSILDAAESVGISFGAMRGKVRSEAVKNALLSAMPQLQWAGVNTYGCVAIISVEERTEIGQINKFDNVSSIVAKCDGFVKEITVTRGSALCKVGEAVTAGQVLISGYTDCGIIIKATAAQGEVYAETGHNICAITPIAYTQRTQKKREVRKYSVIFGKKIINLFKDSGISPNSCVKIYEEKYLTLPGGFQLPFGLACEKLIHYDNEKVTSDDIQSYSWLEQYSDAYLLSQMVAGKILDKQVKMKHIDEVVCFDGNYSCYEMIGQIYNEEIHKRNE